MDNSSSRYAKMMENLLLRYAKTMDSKRAPIKLVPGLEPLHRKVVQIRFFVAILDFRKLIKI